MAATTAALALLATTAAGVAPAVALSSATTTTAAVPQAAEDKLTTAARDELTEHKTADFWVKMADRADTSAARDISDWTERGQYVVDKLQATARESQAGVVADLEKAGADYEAFWISNRVLVKDGTLDLAMALAGSPEVREIRETVVLDKPDPVEAEPVKAGPAAVEWGIAEIGAPEAWAMGVTGAGITVSSVDTGTQYDHPALVNQYRGNNGDGTFTHDYNWFDTSGRCSGAPCDTAGNSSHGTHTMGTMVGDDGAENHIGVAPGATWVEANGCDSCSDADLLEAGQWIANPTDLAGRNPDVSKRPHIVNNSWGYRAAGVIDDWYADITTAWEDSGIFGVWAAGNAGPSCNTTSSPGANTDNYSVGNYTQSGTISSSSSRGAGEDGLVKPNIAAPGTSVRSSIVGSGYGLLSGTSMAAPHVAGAVALLWSYSPAMIGDIEGTKALLDRTARDTDNTSCGGTAEDNNVFGEGKLDVMALLDAAPSEGVGTFAGTVTDTNGAPVAGATVTAAGDDLTRTVTTGEDGAFSVPLTEGDYTVTTTAYGYLDATTSATIVPDETTTISVTLQAAPSHRVSGTVTDGAHPVAGATVTIASQLEPVVTGTDGTFTFESVPAGTYTLSATAGICLTDASQELVVDGDENVTLTIDPVQDDFGYTCSESEAPYLQGDTPVTLTGDDAWTSIPLPFDFPLYDGVYDTAYVSSNGHVNFLAGATALGNVPIPAASAPNAALYPFWDDLYLDADSQVLTGTTTVGDEDAFTIEWRNARKYSPSTDRLSFSATVVADGTVIFGYGTGTATDTAKGSSATVGIENAAGTVAYQYSHNTPFARDGLTVTFDAPALGTVEGVVKDYNTKAGVEGATVTAVDPDGEKRSVKTGADGQYSLKLPLARYDLTFEADGYETATKRAPLDTEGEVLTRNAQLNAGRIAVSTESVAASLAMGGSATRNVRVTNTGSAPVDVELAASGTGFEVLGGGTSAGVIKHVVGDATVARSTAPKGTAATPDGGTSLGTAGTSRMGTAAERSVTPQAEPVAAGDTVLTHSASQAIVANNSASCNDQVTTDLNQYLRTFTLADFDISSDFEVSEVSFGVETTQAGQPITVNLYTLTGELRYANLKLVGSADTVLGAQTQSIVTVPVEGVVPKGGTLVVEVVAAAGGRFFIGSNGDGQSAPSYIASEACDIPEPTDTADIGFEDMHIVMNVTGQTSGGEPGWLEVQPPSFTLAPGQSVTAVATMTAAVDQPGTYTGTIAVGAETPYAEPNVTATMTVKQPAGWGKITGVVTGGGEPIEGAVVHLDGTSYDVTLVTGSDGVYSYWMQKSNAPLQVVVAAEGFVPETRKAQIVAGQTTVYNFDLDPLG